MHSLLSFTCFLQTVNGDTTALGVNMNGLKTEILGSGVAVNQWQHSASCDKVDTLTYNEAFTPYNKNR